MERTRVLMLYSRDIIKLSVLLILLGGILASCAPMTSYSPDIATQSSLFGKLSTDDAVSLLRKKTRSSGVDADHGSFALDTKGFRYTKTETVTKKVKISGELTEMELDETRIQQVAWQGVTRLEPFLKETIIGDLYGERLLFSESNYLSSTGFTGSSELNLHCDNYSDLTEVMAALRTLTGK